MHRHFQHPHVRHLAAAATSLTNHDTIRNAPAMAPRDALPSPIEGVQDIGDFVNGTLSAASRPYFYGLAGVNQNANYMFVNILVASFCGLLFFTFIYRWWTMGNRHMRHLFTMGKREDQRYWQMNHTHWWPRLKKNLIYAPLGKQRHNREFNIGARIQMGTLPTRYHTLLLFLYVASNIAYCMVLDYSQESFAILAELRGRTGIMAALNVIPTILFALRNNPFIPILGVSYDTFNLLHRWCARAVIIEATVHTLCWAANAIATGGQEQVRLSLSSSTSYRWGMVSTAAFGAIFIFAAGPIRHYAYETFLNCHRLLVLTALIGLYVHIDAANLPMRPYMQLCFALWGFEWAWRWFRIFYHNVSRQKGITKVTVEALPAEACRVTFELSRPWRWTPGCHVHMYVPALALWSSHPFSIAWAENKSREAKELEMEVKHTGVPQFDSQVALQNLANQGRPVRPPFVTRDSTFSRLSGANAGSIATVAEVTHRPDQPNIALPRDANVSHISLVCRAREGLTRKMFDKASQSPGNTFTTWGAIEGPYGGHESLASYGTVVLFAGGVGITHQVGYLKHLILSYQAGTSSTRKILLVWSVPNTEALEWVRVWMDEVLRMEGRRDILRIQLFISKPKSRHDVISSTGSVTMHPGRCNPKTIIEKEMAERIGAMGVTVCGPGAFSDSVRSAVREQVGLGNVDFVEEAFTY